MTEVAAPAEKPIDLQKYAWLSIATGVVVFLLKLVAWKFTGSVGLLSDALESTVNIVAAIIALLALRTLPGWTRRGETLTRVYRFASFRDALAFMVRGGFEAEALNHHPEWTNVYDRVSVVLTTHDAGGRLTAKDVELARRLDAAAGRDAVP